jgi:hypothetical protein
MNRSPNDERGKSFQSGRTKSPISAIEPFDHGLLLDSGPMTALRAASETAAATPLYFFVWHRATFNQRVSGHG